LKIEYLPNRWFATNINYCHSLPFLVRFKVHIRFQKSVALLIIFNLVQKCLSATNTATYYKTGCLDESTIIFKTLTIKMSVLQIFVCTITYQNYKTFFFHH
jgi:hypothetical protein